MDALLSPLGLGFCLLILLVIYLSWHIANLTNNLNKQKSYCELLEAKWLEAVRGSVSVKDWEDANGRSVEDLVAAYKKATESLEVQSKHIGTLKKLLLDPDSSFGTLSKFNQLLREYDGLLGCLYETTFLKASTSVKNVITLQIAHKKQEMVDLIFSKEPSDLDRNQDGKGGT